MYRKYTKYQENFTLINDLFLDIAINTLFLVPFFSLLSHGNAYAQDFSLDIFLRQQWVDNRLDHGLNKTMSLSNTVIGKIWMPDSYFVNAKHGSFHKVTTDNMMIMILPGGLVKYNARSVRYSVDLQIAPKYLY